MMNVRRCGHMTVLLGRGSLDRTFPGCRSGRLFWQCSLRLAEPKRLSDHAETLHVLHEAMKLLGAWAHRRDNCVVRSVRAGVRASRQVADAQLRSRHVLVLSVGDIVLVLLHRRNVGSFEV